MTYYRCGREEAYFLAHSSSTCAQYFLWKMGKQDQKVMTGFKHNPLGKTQRFHRKMIVILVNNTLHCISSSSWTELH